MTHCPHRLPQHISNPTCFPTSKIICKIAFVCKACARGPMLLVWQASWLNPGCPLHAATMHNKRLCYPELSIYMPHLLYGTQQPILCCRARLCCIPLTAIVANNPDVRLMVNKNLSTLDAMSQGDCLMCNGAAPHTLN